MLPQYFLVSFQENLYLKKKWLVVYTHLRKAGYNVSARSKNIINYLHFSSHTVRLTTLGRIKRAISGVRANYAENSRRETLGSKTVWKNVNTRQV